MQLKSDDEFSHLAAVSNSMTRKLHASHNDLMLLNRMPPEALDRYRAGDGQTVTFAWLNGFPECMAS